MNCPCCGAAELIHDTRHTPYIYKGDATTIPAVKGDFCPACGVVVLNKEQGDRYGEFIRQMSKSGKFYCHDFGQYQSLHSPTQPFQTHLAPTNQLRRFLIASLVSFPSSRNESFVQHRLVRE